MKKQISFFITFFLLFFFSQAYAQTFAVKPASLQFPLEPGQSAYRNLTVTNLTDAPKTYNLTTGDFLIDSLGNTLRRSAGSTEHSCAKWIQVTPSTFRLAPNESRSLQVRITVPEGNDRTTWAELYVQAEEELSNLPSLADKGMQSQLLAQGRIAVPVLQSPESNTRYEAAVSNLREVSDRDGRRVFRADLVNSGGKLVVGRLLRSIVDLESGRKTQLPGSEIALLPGQVRSVETELPRDLAPGHYSLTTVWQVDYQRSPKGARLEIKVQ